MLPSTHNRNNNNRNVSVGTEKLLKKRVCNERFQLEYYVTTITLVHPTHNYFSRGEQWRQTSTTSVPATHQFWIHHSQAKRYDIIQISCQRFQKGQTKQLSLLLRRKWSRRRSSDKRTKIALRRNSNYFLWHRCQHFCITFREIVQSRGYENHANNQKTRRWVYWVSQNNMKYSPIFIYEQRRLHWTVRLNLDFIDSNIT